MSEFKAVGQPRVQITMDLKDAWNLRDELGRRVGDGAAEYRFFGDLDDFLKAETRDPR